MISCKKSIPEVKSLSNKKDCKLVSAATAATSATPARPALYSCAYLDAHFFRNWWTGSDQDVQLNDNFVGKNYDAIGWIASYADSTYSASKVVSQGIAKPVQFQAITKAYLDKKAADGKKILDDAG